MGYKFIYQPAALIEYKKSVGWYLERSEIAAENFIKDINHKIINVSIILQVIEIRVKTFMKHH